MYLYINIVFPRQFLGNFKAVGLKRSSTWWKFLLFSSIVPIKLVNNSLKYIVIFSFQFDLNSLFIVTHYLALTVFCICCCIMKLSTDITEVPVFVYCNTS